MITRARLHAEDVSNCGTVWHGAGQGTATVDDVNVVTRGCKHVAGGGAGAVLYTCFCVDTEEVLRLGRQTTAGPALL